VSIAGTLDLADLPSVDSILAPLLIDFHRQDSHIDLVELVTRTAAKCVPYTWPRYRMRLAGKKSKPVMVRHTRRILTGLDKAFGARLYRLCDTRGEEVSSDNWSHYLWQVNVTLHADSIDGVPGARRVCVAVSRCQISRGAVKCAPELALFRHLIVEGYRALDHELVVTGGQCGWNYSWWPLPVETAT